MVSQTKSQSALDDNTKNFTKTFTKQICILQTFSENVSLFLLKFEKLVCSMSYFLRKQLNKNNETFYCFGGIFGTFNYYTEAPYICYRYVQIWKIEYKKTFQCVCDIFVSDMEAVILTNIRTKPKFW